ncbi:ABC-2 transporter permease [Gallibacter sp. Marseille-QA0791]|uniref:ABC-2 transporter permease n=1 Tax=Gallibacter sp. Marseille-QA0791 TaxID=3378781 RepID=UPI003D0FFFF5
MKGLLMKDIILLRPQLKIYLIILVFWFLIAMWNGQPGFFGGLMAMFALMIPMTTVAYDDNCKWPAFALTAPVPRFKLVLSKYVILFMTMLVLSVIIFIGSLVMGEDVSGSFFLTVAMFPFGMIMASVLLPIIFKFGVEKGRFAFLAFIAFVVAAVVAGGRKLATLTEDGNIVGSLLSMNRGMMIGAVVLVTAAVAVISIVLSKNIYDKKEF